MKCTVCDWAGVDRDGILNLLPSVLSSEKQNENLIHIEDKEQSCIWKDLLYKKKFYIDRLEKHWKKHFLRDDAKSFLEIGGGLCYISAAIKHQRPDMVVWATDVSPEYIRSKSVVVGNFMDVKIDQYASVDAENMPFEDETFDIVFVSHSIHHIGDTKKFFSEANRILKKGGVFFGVDVIAPRLEHFYDDDANKRAQRGEPLGIHERSIKLADYKKDLDDAGIKNYVIKHEKYDGLKNLYSLKVTNLWRGVTVMIKFEKL